MTTTRHRRRYPRISVDQIPGLLTLLRGGEVLNISPAGIGVRTTTPLRIGKHVSLRLARPSAVLEVQGVVHWCRLTGTRRTEEGASESVYEAGIGIDPEFRLNLSGLLSFLGSEPLVIPDRRVEGRYAVEIDATLALYENHLLQVRIISLSGALVETDVRVPLEARVRVDFDLGGERFESFSRIAMVEERVEDGKHVVALGLEFLQPNAEAREALQRYIDAQIALEEPSG